MRSHLLALGVGVLGFAAGVAASVLVTCQRWDSPGKLSGDLDDGPRQGLPSAVAGAAGAPADGSDSRPSPGEDAAAPPKGSHRGQTSESLASEIREIRAALGRLEASVARLAASRPSAPILTAGTQAELPEVQHARAHPEADLPQALRERLASAYRPELEERVRSGREYYEKLRRGEFPIDEENRRRFLKLFDGSGDGILKELDSIRTWAGFCGLAERCDLPEPATVVAAGASASAGR